VQALEKIKGALDIEYTYESNRIEGNTLTLQETALVVSEGVTIGGKSMREHLEAINHAQAITLIKEMATRESAITERAIKEIHAVILHGIDREYAGRYRDVPVMIVGSRHAPPQPYLLQTCMETFIAGHQSLLASGAHPIIVAAHLHDELARIHPFIDGNGRASRLLMNLHLLSVGYPVTSLKADDAAKRTYYAALEESHIGHDPRPFHLLVARAVLSALERYLSVIEG
jgi:Fic family protein